MAGAENPFEDLFRRADGLLHDSVAFMAEQTEHLEELGDRVATSISEWTSIVVDHLSLHGTLPMPGLPHLPSSKSVKIPIRSAPEPPRQLSRYESFVGLIKHRPYLWTLVFTSALAGTTTYLWIFKPHLLASLPLIGDRLPLDRSKRVAPLSVRRVRPRISAGTDQRLEAVIVLGCDRGTLGRSIALFLEQSGFIVIASVSQQDDVKVLESESQGYLKAVYLDPTQPSTLSPYLRGLSNALSLGYPLKRAGDPYSSAKDMPAVTSLVNCLPVLEHCVERPEASITPLEAMPANDAYQSLFSLLTTTHECLRGILPLMRTVGKRRDNTDSATILTLVPATSSRLVLPFLGSQSTAINALVSMLDTFRRELQCATVSNGDKSIVNVNFKLLDVGFVFPEGQLSAKRHPSAQSVISVDSASSQGSFANAAHARDHIKDLPRHLQHLYGPTLTLRTLRPPTEATSGSKHHHKRAQVKSNRALDQLKQKVLDTLVSPSIAVSPMRWLNQGGLRSSVGPRSSAYWLAGMLPTRFVDTWLTAVDWSLSNIARRQGLIVESNQDRVRGEEQAESLIAQLTQSREEAARRLHAESDLEASYAHV
ncbi:uncharacterized protein L969DRAFT_52539 [Mixia osmundae IAM 14324]|uniref:Uncharacterized protein n=1 Tax=Mixia osmundae (strain CBS 9802 / IAM 14324 / JCM 22182 / KY 12970) TaxID=764103 RepID=G7E4V9_MIXOS|nr:uncharacterized protein L969DRAFT_52539 [Mixia osmundae IAM 14324]KEI37732.1 hypothetical protein L969DRAFT_52539 [Mixia osmundae IAM 14324]GAA97869.1 hypothetical protein E5Q_04549 [Mixia osmundae IAM 14324]